MTGRQWKPGDVAMLAWSTYPETRAMYYGGRGWRDADSATFNEGEDSLSLRPLVVIDPEDREQVERLSEAIRDAEKSQGRDFWEYDQKALTAALRSLITAPKPDEPLGLGAVVATATGKRWLHAYVDTGGKQWIDSNGRVADYADIPAVKVLSEGVTA